MVESVLRNIGDGYNGTHVGTSDGDGTIKLTLQ